MSKPRIIAFYLPQFYPTPENDEWWGKGFTEWTNVGRAKPLFKEHNQPRVPTELGYYDLRLPIVREQQSQMARDAGVEGFCYWHYWFGNGKRLLSEVFQEVLETGKPDFPFCLGWANHSWYAKTWKKDVADKLLCEQNYFGKKDYDAHFEYVLKAFKDERYIKVEGNPLFYIFDPQKLPDDFIPYWNNKAKENGFDKIYFVGRIVNSDIETILNKGFNAVVPERMGYIYEHNPLYKRIIHRTIQLLINKPRFLYDYADAAKYFVNEIDKNEYVIPQIIPQWDHSPRSATRGMILHNSTPKKFASHVEDVLNIIKNKKNKLIFLKSWNEWGEGNYMEPDLTYGRGFIDALRNTINEYNEQIVL